MTDTPAPQSAQPEVAPAATPGPSGLLTLAVSVVVLGALYVGREVFVPIVLAVLLAFVLAPLVDQIRRLRIGRVPSVIVAVLLALGIMISLGAVIGLQVADLGANLPRYEQTVRAKIASLKDGTLGRLPQLMRSFNRQMQDAAKDNPAEAGRAAPENQEPAPLPVEVHEPEATPAELARNVLLPILAPLATVGIVFVVLVFILLQREDLRDRMIRLFGSNDLHRTTLAMDDAARRLSRYFLIQLGLNATFGVIISLGLWAIGVPSPILWGIFGALMRFIPYIGSILAGALPFALAAAVDPGWSMALTTLVMIVVVELLMGHAVEPVVYGQSTGLSPFSVVIAAVFWTWLWGPIGLLLATPMTLCLVVLGRHVERLEFLDVLLGDRPALSPAENLYQRMLAGDPDEALEFAEQLLKERSLASYYDDVVLRGLQLAANDAQRGVLDGGRLQRIKSAIQALVHDLNSHDDVEPDKAKAAQDPVAPRHDEREDPKRPAIAAVAPSPESLPDAWAQPGAVLCIAGRGPLDEAAAAMLAQLLGKHGLGTRIAPYEAVSRSAIMGFDLKGVRMVCISYLDIAGSPAHLRYLMRRLRQRIGAAPILVGLWPADEAILSDESVRRAVGADYAVASLHDAVIRCLEAAHRDGAPAPADPKPVKPPAQLAPPVERAPLPA